jgi:cell division protein FtsB
VRLLAGLLAVAIIWSLQLNANRNQHSADSLRQFEKQLDQRTDQNSQLRQRLEKSQDQLYLEKLQRNELLMTGENEVVLQVADDFYQEHLAADATEQLKVKSAWEEWVEIIIF